MVHPLGLLEDGDIASSPPPRDVEEDEEDIGKYSDTDSEREYGQDGEE